MIHRLQFGAAALSLFVSAAASAGTATANLSVTATVSSNCTVTTQAVAFGSYDPASASPQDATGAVAVTCTVGTTYSISLNAGANASAAGDATTRRLLANTSDVLPYTLYLDAGHATIWGDGNNGTSVNPASGTFTGDGTEQSHSAFGRIVAGQFVAPGSYADAVVATITYN